MMEADATVDQDALRHLAERRADAVRQYLLNKIADNRMFVPTPKLDAKGIDGKGKTKRDDFWVAYVTARSRAIVAPSFSLFAFLLPLLQAEGSQRGRGSWTVETPASGNIKKQNFIPTRGLALIFKPIRHGSKVDLTRHIPIHPRRFR